MSQTDDISAGGGQSHAKSEDSNYGQHSTEDPAEGGAAGKQSGVGDEAPTKDVERGADKKQTSKKEAPDGKKKGTIAKKPAKSTRNMFYHISKSTSFRLTMSTAVIIFIIALVSLILSSIVLAATIKWMASMNSSMDPYCLSSSLGSGCLALDPLAAIPWPGFVAWSALFLLTTFLAFHGAMR
jgi:hypothetical protein